MRAALIATLLGGASCDERTAADDGPTGGDTDLPPHWRVERVQLPPEAAGRVFHDIFGYGDGALFVVGQYGMILTNRAPAGATDADGNSIEGQATTQWRVMPTPTNAHLTSITGLRNGDDYGYPATYGEMFAVGWEGTLLHFHPDPDGDPTTLDGAWRLISGPEGDGLLPVARIDPACPDRDGDGIADDGDGTGFWGDNLCVGGATTDCDDNCRDTPNGPQRPLVDRQTCADDPNECGCIGPGDTPDPAQSQIDDDGDGRGLRCDMNDPAPDGFDPAPRLTAPLFSVTAVRGGDGDVRVMAVGGDGALVTFRGPAVGPPVVPPARDIELASGWRAQLELPFFYDDDCPGQGVPRGEVCPGVATRLPPSCPAQCSPLRRACGINCPAGEAPCCDPTAPTGAGCSDGSCGPAPNACDVIRVGLCETACADCFRRLGRTLRAVATDYGNGCPGCGVLAVGRGGTILYGDPLDPESEWTGITCAVPPSPLDEEPVIAGVAASDDTYIAVGAGGAVFFIDPAAGRGGCQRRDVGQTVTGGVRVESLAGAPGVFLSDVWAIDARRAFVVGDAGTLLQIEPDRVTAIKTGTQENLHAIWRNFDPDSGNPVLWVVGAGGALLRAEFR